MNKMEKAVLCDEILRLFAGNVSVSWIELREKYGDGTTEYHLRENQINFLVSQGQLIRTTDLKGAAGITHLMVLTDNVLLKRKKMLFHCSYDRNCSRMHHPFFIFQVSVDLIKDTKIIILISHLIQLPAIGQANIPF